MGAVLSIAPVPPSGVRPRIARFILVLHNGVMDFNQWLSSLPGSPTPTTAASRSGLASPTLIRHASKGSTTADNTIKIARAFGVSPVDALVDTGFLRPGESDTARVSARQALADLGIEDALRIVVDRVNASGLFEEDFTMDDLGDGADIIEMHDAGELPELLDLSEMPYVADSSPDEPGEGEEGYHDGP